MNLKEKSNQFIQEYPIKIVDSLIDKAHYLQNKKYTQNKQLLDLYHTKKSLNFKKSQIDSLNNTLTLLHSNKSLINSHQYLQNNILNKYSFILQSMIDKDHINDNEYQTKKFIYEEIISNNNTYEEDHVIEFQILNTKPYSNSSELIINKIYQEHFITYRRKDKHILSPSISSNATEETTKNSNLHIKSISQSILNNESMKSLYQKQKTSNIPISPEKYKINQSKQTLSMNNNINHNNQEDEDEIFFRTLKGENAIDMIEKIKSRKLSNDLQSINSAKSSKEETKLTSSRYSQKIEEIILFKLRDIFCNYFYKEYVIKPITFGISIMKQKYNEKNIIRKPMKTNNVIYSQKHK